jgi:RHS repeat-associated protein
VIEDPEGQSKGALIVSFAASLDPTSLAAGVVVELYNGVEWVAVGAQELLVGYDDAAELKVLTREGWARGASYRVRLTTALKDKQSRNLAQAQTYDWRIAATGASSDFSRSFAVEYETAKASLDTLGGRFPGGQNDLFQGLWSDPVTGINYARARWYDARNSSWLSEDPMLNVDSTNLYAFVGLGPTMRKDPRGEYATINEVIAELNSIDPAYLAKDPDLARVIFKIDQAAMEAGRLNGIYDYAQV